MSRVPPLWACAPFVGLLLCIALGPIISRTAHWWEANRHKLLVSLAFAALALGYSLWQGGTDDALSVVEHAVVEEFIPFMTLLFSLYVIAGGISLRGDLPAWPVTNTAFLAAGALLASVVGTTGASMLLIRPLLQTNSERRRVTHTVIFFIFLVSNIGGCLLPIGDPPLFLGFLMGVPFLWTLGLWKEWLFTCALLLVIYYFVDRRAHAGESSADVAADLVRRTPLSLRGGVNFFWVAGVVLCTAAVRPGEELPWVGVKAFAHLRELLLVGMTVGSLWTTPRGVREANRFNYGAILEVAALFVGIFICMQAPVAILHAKGSELPLHGPGGFFWATGALSSFLDNAPTYVVFFSLAESLTHSSGPGILTLAGGQFIREDLLVGISLGAVFMGAMTYIGNGPNFMVKAIAEQSGVRMPTFFGYMLYSVGILLPVLLVVAFVFV